MIVGPLLADALFFVVGVLHAAALLDTTAIMALVIAASVKT